MVLQDVVEIYSYCTIAHFNKIAEVFGLMALLLYSGDMLYFF